MNNMKLKEFKNLKRQIEKLLKKAEDEAVEEGINITSSKFQDILVDAKKGILSKQGLTIEQYNELETRIEEAEEEDGQDVSILTNARVLLMKTKGVIGEVDSKIKKIDNVEKATNDLSQKIKEVERKQLREEDVKQLIPKVKGYDREIEHLSRKIDNIKIPEMPEPEDWTGRIQDIEKQARKDKKETEKTVKEETKKQLSKALNPSIFGTPKVFKKKDINKLIKDYLDKNLQIRIPWSGGGRSFQFSDGETPTGAVNGANKDFVLANTPDPVTSLAVFVNTTRKTLTTDYTLSGTTITMTSAPRSGAILRCDYRY